MALPKLSSLRRFVQGAGIDFRYAYLAAGVDNTPNIGTRTPVPGLLDDSVVVAVEDLTTPADLQSQWAPERFGQCDFNDAVMDGTITAIQSQHGRIFLALIDTNVADDPLIVTVVTTATGAAISVQLAQSSSAVITSTAHDVLSALLTHPVAGKLLGNSRIKTGDSGAGLMAAHASFEIGTDPDAFTAEALSDYENKQGASYGRLLVSSTADVNDNNDNDIYLESAVLGDQSAVTYEQVNAGGTVALSVAVVDSAITVTLATTSGTITSTAADVVAALRASAAAAALVRASVSPTYGGVGDGLVKEFGDPYGTAMSAGNVAGIILAGDNDSVAIKVSWYDRRNAGENDHGREKP